MGNHRVIEYSYEVRYSNSRGTVQYPTVVANPSVIITLNRSQSEAPLKSGSRLAQKPGFGSLSAADSDISHARSASRVGSRRRSANVTDSLHRNIATKSSKVTLLSRFIQLPLLH